MQYFSRNPFSIYILQPHPTDKPVKTKDFPAKYPTPPGGRGYPFETQTNHPHPTTKGRRNPPLPTLPNTQFTTILPQSRSKSPKSAGQQSLIRSQALT